MTEMIMVPGIGGSGEAHWQTRWERLHPGIRRFQPGDWDQPELTDWTLALEQVVAASASPPILIAHSLGCLLVAHWQRESCLEVAGAFLVAVPNPQSAAFPKAAASFANPPRQAWRLASLMVTSTDDPYSSGDYSVALAQTWGSRLVEIGAFGHINGQSGLQDWPQGWALLNRFKAEIGA